MRFRPIRGIAPRRPDESRHDAAPPQSGASALDGAVEDDVELAASPADGDLQLRIGGITCAGCAATIRDGLLQLPGVASAGVSPVTHRAVLRPDGTLDPDDLAMLAEAAIMGLGYRVVPT